jgi:uncharacterized protein (PEP-CTERM system associated)
MRFGKPDNKYRAVARCALAAAAAVTVMRVDLLSTSALADVFRLRPIFEIEQILTDNVRADSDDRDADAITVVSLALNATWQTSRINAGASVDLFYNEYWATNDLDAANAAGTAAMRFDVIEDIFYIDAVADRGEVLLQSDDQTASGLTPGDGRLQQTNYSVTPTFKLNLFVADLLVRGHYGQVIFDEPVVGTTTTVLDDIAVKQAAGRLTTGDRSTLYEAFVGAEYLETDIGFEQRNVIGGAIVNIMPNFSAIGRYGYERIFDPSFPIIHGQVWSAGGIVRLGQASTIHAEYGKRFGGTSWLGDLNLVLTPRTTLTGTYRDTLTPAQLTLVRGIEELLDPDGDFDFSQPTTPNIANPLVLDEIVRDKEANITASYVYGVQTWALSFNHFQRLFPALQDQESSFSVDATMSEQLSRQLRSFFLLQYEDLYEVIGDGATSKIYRAGVSFQYRFNEDYQAAGGYLWQLDTTTDNSTDTQQSVLRFSLTRAL